MLPLAARDHPATVIVFGNEKGGSGKSTAAMHVVVGLLRQGYRVATVDLDARQGTLSRCVENRLTTARTEGGGLPCPTHRRFAPSQADSQAAREADDSTQLAAIMEDLSAAHDFIIIDTPGTDNALNRLGHSYADTLVTPINDSFIDLDLLATVDPDSLEILRPSIYAEMVWEQRKQRFSRDRGAFDWIVMRNRLGHTEARNKRDIAQILDRLARRIGFRLAPGFGERVIFRELFLRGLTLLDLKEVAGGPALTLSHVAARQEVRALIDTIDPERRRNPETARRSA